MKRIARLSFVAALALGIIPLVAIPAHAATITVNSTADTAANDGVCTFREAITAADTDTASGAMAGECAAGNDVNDTITFDIAGAGPHTIAPTSALPFINEAVVIDGYCGTCDGASVNTLATGTNAVLKIELSGQNAGLANGLATFSSSAIIRGLVINRWQSIGIQLSPGKAQGNFIGTNTAGTASLPNGVGVLPSGSSPGVEVGGTAPEDRNLISGNFGAGIFVFDGHFAVVHGNLIGTDATGNLDLGNGADGVVIFDSFSGSDNNTIGGTAAGAGNVISGNNANGVVISGDLSNGNTVQGNLIGTNAAGTGVLGNNLNGVVIDEAPSNLIGGDTAAERNVISGNVDGVRIQDATAIGNDVWGNYIGLNAAGTVDLGNFADGVHIDGAPGTRVGSSIAGTGNVISGNDDFGVLIDGAGATGNSVQGNLIGTDPAGSSSVLFGNGDSGVRIASPDNVVGGPAPGEGNVISANGLDGVDLLMGNATGNLVQGNIIGLDASGTVDTGNQFSGVSIGPDAADNTIGGTAAGAGNLISGNDAFGVAIFSSADDNVVQGNRIGIDASGTAPIGNFFDGVVINESSGNVIGGTAAGAGNVISGNGDNGVLVDGSGADENPILRNSIFDNDDLGIDLDNDGVTPNDPNDPDTGSNDEQNFPVLTSVSTGSTTVEGTLNSLPSTTFRLEFFNSPDCDPSGNGEGAEFMGSENVTTDAGGDVAFSKTFSQTIALGSVVTATATRLDSGTPTDTSEFSACLAVEGADLSINKTDSPDPATVGEPLTYTLTVTNAGPDTVLAVQAQDNLPGGVTFTSANASQGSCAHDGSPQGGFVTCSLGALVSGAQATVTIVVTPTAAGTIQNTAQVSGGQNDPQFNNTDTENTQVNPPGQNQVAISPASDTNPVTDTSHTITVTITDPGNAPVQNRTARLEITQAAGASVADPDCDTAANGQCEITIQHDGTTPGTTEFIVCEDENPANAACGPPADEPRAQGSKTWAAPAPQECPGFEGVAGNHILGTNNDDIVVGTPGVDIICLFDGNDRAEGMGGNDIIDGGRDNDDLFGGDGNDRLFGRAGDDEGDGGPGDDKLRDFGDGDDVLRGQEGDDLLVANLGTDTLLGGQGEDTARGNRGSDDLSGNTGADLLAGGPGDDLLRGAEDADTLRGGDDTDDLFGGPAADTLNGGGGTNDECTGGPGIDAIQATCETQNP